MKVPASRASYQESVRPHWAEWPSETTGNLASLQVGKGWLAPLIRGLEFSGGKPPFPTVNLPGSPVSSMGNVATDSGSLSTHNPAQRHFGDLISHLVARQTPIGMVPARQPEHHTQQAECG